jgi:hypothetical protein
MARIAVVFSPHDLTEVGLLAILFPLNSKAQKPWFIVAFLFPRSTLHES